MYQSSFDEKEVQECEKWTGISDTTPYDTIAVMIKIKKKTCCGIKLVDVLDTQNE
jgi:hypothetical protein